MVDIHNAERRSYNMSQIRSKNTKPEVLLRKALWKEGFRYTLKNKDLPGNPDIAFRKRRVVIFVDGCFWHGCPEHFKKPSSNVDFWENKIKRNTDRDIKTNKLLKQAGWRIIRIWEHDLKKKNFPSSLKKIIKAIK